MFFKTILAAGLLVASASANPGLLMMKLIAATKYWRISMLPRIAPTPASSTTLIPESLLLAVLDSKELSTGLTCASQAHTNISLINVWRSSVEKMMQAGRRYILPPGKFGDF
jgi:hypothetical protein